MMYVAPMTSIIPQDGSGVKLAPPQAVQGHINGKLVETVDV